MSQKRSKSKDFKWKHYLQRNRFLTAQYPNQYHIDQRTTTTLLVSFARKVGHEQATTIIRRQLRGYCDSAYFKAEELTQIQSYGTTSKQF